MLRWVTPLIFPLIVLLLWELAVRSDFWPPAIVAPPSQVGPAFVRLLADGSLFKHATVSLGRLAAGLGLGVAVGIFLGALVGLSKLSDELLAPLLRFLAPIPTIAWIPLLIVTFGIDGSRIALIAIGTALVLYASTLSAIREIPFEYIELGKVFQKRPPQMLLWIILPASAWQVLTGCRVAAALAWVLLLASEMIASSKGLGWLIFDARNFSRADEMMVGMVVVGLLGFLTDEVIAILQERAARWRRTFRGL